MRGGQYSGGLIGHSTGRRSLHGWGDTRVSPQPWREIDAHAFTEVTEARSVENNALKRTVVTSKQTFIILHETRRKC